MHPSPCVRLLGVLQQLMLFQSFHVEYVWSRTHGVDVVVRGLHLQK
jgi:hypothetical protein